MGGDLFPHEKLEVWQAAKSFAKGVYQTTARSPKGERFGLVDQMRRASVSVMSNLAEGCVRTSARDQAHFSQLAYSSLLELDSQSQFALDLEFLTNDSFQNMRQSILKLAKRISAL